MKRALCSLIHTQAYSRRRFDSLLFDLIFIFIFYLYSAAASASASPLTMTFSYKHTRRWSAKFLVDVAVSAGEGRRGGPACGGWGLQVLQGRLAGALTRAHTHTETGAYSYHSDHYQTLWHAHKHATRSADMRDKQTMRTLAPGTLLSYSFSCFVNFLFYLFCFLFCTRRRRHWWLLLLQHIWLETRLYFDIISI